jgi:hypothetical protein
VVLDGEWSTPRLGPGKETRYPFYRRLGGPQGRSGQLRKFSPPPEFFFIKIPFIHVLDLIQCQYTYCYPFAPLSLFTRVALVHRVLSPSLRTMKSIFPILIFLFNSLCVFLSFFPPLLYVVPLGFDPRTVQPVA